MNIIIHQSVCGENSKKAWDLLKTTLPDVSVAKSIAFKTDLQDQAGGVAWKPTIRGFFQEEFFLLMKTFPDNSAEVRQGRAYSHVLMISKNDIESIIDIAILFKYLPNEIDKLSTVEPISLNPTELSGMILPMGFRERFNKVIHAINKSSDYKNTIIWVGEENYEQAIFQLWQILTLKEKEILNFGINFNLEAISDGKLNFITIPENIESKFLNKQFCVVRRNDTKVLTEFSEQFLAGDPNAGLRIKSFQEAIEVQKLTRPDIDRIAIVIKTFEEIDSIVDLKKLNTLSHIVAEYSPDNHNGIYFKTKLVNRICHLLENATVADVSIVRGFKVKSFKDSEEILSLSVNKWAEKYLFSISETKSNNFVSIFRHLKESKISSWWTMLLENKIKIFLAKINSEKATIIFNWLQKDFEIFNSIRSKIDSSKDSELLFTAHISPQLVNSNFEVLKEFAVKRGWYKFHSTLLRLEYPFKQALSEQLLVDLDLNSVEGIGIIIHGVKSNQIIDFAVMHGDKRLIEIAGNLCYEDSSLSERIDFANVNWQYVLLNSISRGKKLIDSFEEPQKQIFKLFNSIVEGNSINDNLLELISETTFANVLYYPKRDDLFIKLPSTLRTKFLAKTSSALLESLSKDSTFVVPTNKMLSDYIIEHAIGDFLYYNRNNIKSTIPIFCTFDQVPEFILRDYVRYYSGNLDVIDATQLGKLIYVKRYSNVASVIYDKATAYNNWKFALSECYLLLNVFTQMGLALTGLIKNVKITEDQWWNALTEIACKLYGGGPKENKIWIEANGEEYDLLTIGTGKELWIAALKKLRNGGCTGITVDKLLKKMMKEHKRNEELKTINDLKNKL